MNDRSARGRSVGILCAEALALLCLFAVLSVCGWATRVGDARYPEAGDTQLSKGGTTVDISHVDQGYVMVRHTGSSKPLRVRLTKDEAIYTFTLNNAGDYETFPLALGSGKYRLYLYENVKGSSYAQLYADSFKAEMDDESSVFLYPNQYAWYTQDSKAVEKSAALCEGLGTDREKLDAIFGFVKNSILYDYIKALNVKAGYVPDVDQTLASGMGICFDTAALMACMLRVQGIPTRLVTGYVTPENIYHAWNEVLVDGEWVWKDASSISFGHTQSDYDTDRWY